MSGAVEYIRAADRLLAIIIYHDFVKDGIHFFTPDDLSQQLAYMKHRRGKIIDAHVHNPAPREVVYTQEVLLIRSGRVRVDFYDERRSYLESRVLQGGDVILLASGGHGFEMLEDSEMVEVKQGPFAGDGDKTRFDGIDDSQAIIKGRSR